MLRRVGPEAPWVQRHVAHCPRCQKRLAGLGKVDLALSIIKSQPHRLDLLMRANSAAMRMLNHDAREATAAKELEQARPEPCFVERCGRYRNPVTNVAACIAILFLTKAGIFSSFDKVHARGEAALKQYYTTQAGEEVAREIFGA
jgi:anti-sigma factor RsiW